jgi:hypothetical protein
MIYLKVFLGCYKDMNKFNRKGFKNVLYPRQVLGNAPLFLKLVIIFPILMQFIKD